MSKKYSSKLSVKRRNSTAELLNISKTFVPKILIEGLYRLIDNDTITYKIEPKLITFNSVILIVDISGFTRLSGNYCRDGKDGIDSLQLIINNFIGLLVDIIYYYQGDIIKFAGDAIICTFTNNKIYKLFYNDTTTSNMSSKSDIEFDTFVDAIDNSSHTNNFNQSLLLNVLRCAFELSNCSTDELTVHVGISTGDISFAIIGGYNNQWENLIAGECISEISSCLDDAKSKEVVATSTFINLLNNNQNSLCTIEKLSSGNVKLINNSNSNIKPSEQLERTKSLIQWSESRDMMCDDSILIKKLTNFVPYPILQSLQVSDINNNITAELREVTVMFMKWDNYKNDSNNNINSFQNFYCIVQEIIIKSGGFIRQFLIDDKGCVLIACWGVPTASYINNALRALTVSAQLHNTLISNNIITSFGITTGNVYCGTVGSSIRREYAVIGDIVNLSARLMCKANSGIIIDESTYTRLPIEIITMLTKLEPITVKGKAEAITIYSLVDISNNNITILSNILNNHNYSSSDNYIVRTVHINTLLLLVNDMHNDNIINKLTRGLSRGLSLLRSNSGMNNNNNGQMITKAPSIRNLFSNNNSNNIDTIQVVYIEGAVGTGKASLLRVFKEECLKKERAIIDINLNIYDKHNNYLLLRTLYHHLINTIHSNKDVQYQSGVIMDIIESIYPLPIGNSTNKHTDEIINNRNRLLGIMKYALGVSNNITLKLINSDTDTSKRSLNSFKRNKNNNSYTDVEVIGNILLVLQFLLKKIDHVIIIINNINYSDYVSYTVLIRLLSLSGYRKVLVVCTALTIDNNNNIINIHTPFLKKKNNSNNNINSIINNIYINNYEEFRYTLFQSITNNKTEKQLYRNVKLLKLDFFTESEIEAIICTALHKGSIPVDLVKLVHQLSGGSAYWVREMVDYIVATGVEVFLSKMNEQKHDSLRIHNNTIVTNTTTATNNNNNNTAAIGDNSNNGIKMPKLSILDSSSNSSKDEIGLLTESDKLANALINFRSMGSWVGDINDNNSYNNNNNNFKLNPTPSAKDIYNNRTAISPRRSASSNKLTKSNNESNNSNDNSIGSDSGTGNYKLQLFLISRFELLSTTEQRVLKLMSIVGYEVPYSIISLLVPTKLLQLLSEILLQLEKHHWIKHTTTSNHNDESSYNGDTVFDISNSNNIYKFSNKLISRTIYELTPSSERLTIHIKITELINSNYNNNPSYYYLLSRQYRYFNKYKAFYYNCKRIIYIINSNTNSNNSYESIIECTELMAVASNYCEDIYDVDIVTKLLTKLMMIIRNNTKKISVKLSKKYDNYNSKNSHWLLCCGCNSNTVLPAASYYYNDSSSDKNCSTSENSSRVTYLAYNSIKDRLQDIETQLHLLHAKYTSNNNSNKTASANPNNAESSNSSNMPSQLQQELLESIPTSGSKHSKLRKSFMVRSNNG